MKCLLSFFYLVILVSIGQSWTDDGEAGVIINSPRVTNFGISGPFEFCPTGTVVKGFALKVEPRRQRFDNTALNGITFFCGKANKALADDSMFVSSTNGEFGFYGPMINCTGSSYGIGFQLKSQEYQGPFRDDVAAVNLKLICSNGERLEGYDEDGEDYSYAFYTDPQICPRGKAICGIQTQVEEYQRFRDDTSLNNLRAYCCRVSSPKPPLKPLPPIELDSSTTPASIVEGSTPSVVTQGPVAPETIVVTEGTTTGHVDEVETSSSTAQVVEPAPAVSSSEATVSNPAGASVEEEAAAIAPSSDSPVSSSPEAIAEEAAAASSTEAPAGNIAAAPISESPEIKPSVPASENTVVEQSTEISLDTTTSSPSEVNPSGSSTEVPYNPESSSPVEVVENQEMSSEIPPPQKPIVEVPVGSPSESEPPPPST